MRNFRYFDISLLSSQMFYTTGLVALLSALSIVATQEVPNSWPKNYTGIPSGDYSPQWQSCTYDVSQVVAIRFT